MSYLKSLNWPLYYLVTIICWLATLNFVHIIAQWSHAHAECSKPGTQHTRYEKPLKVSYKLLIHVQHKSNTLVYSITTYFGELTYCPVNVIDWVKLFK